MQHHKPAPFPLPDVVRTPSAPPRLPPLPSPEPEFLIIGLFALRLTKRLIEGLEYYPGRDADITWLANFLAPYHQDYALAKISGPRKDDYIDTYQGIVSRMKRQPRYPVRFMQMNPDQSMQQARRGVESERPREMTDGERLDIIDFCDAAGEWGSIVPIPAREAERMIELADQRRIADLDGRQSQREDRVWQREDRRLQREDDLLYRDERRLPRDERRLPLEDRRLPLEDTRLPRDEDRRPFRNNWEYFEQHRR